MAIKAEDYNLDDEKLGFCTSPEVLANQHEELPQDNLGYSDEMMLALYEIAVKLSADKRHDEAVAAFTFITTLNPRVAPFWIGLGVAQSYQQDLESALKSYLKAIEVEPENVDGYMYVVKFHLDRNDAENAMAIVEEGRQRAEHSEQPEAWEDFLEMAPAIEAVIKEGVS